jgi:hypothetical protein
VSFHYSGSSRVASKAGFLYQYWEKNIKEAKTNADWKINDNDVDYFQENLSQEMRRDLDQ